MRLFYGRLFPFREMFTCAGHASPAHYVTRGLTRPARALPSSSWLAYGNDARLPQSDATFFQVCCASLVLHCWPSNLTPRSL